MGHVQRRSGGHTRAVGLALQQPFMWGPKPAMDLNRKRVEGRAPLVEPKSPQILERFEIFLDFKTSIGMGEVDECRGQLRCSAFKTDFV